MKTFTISNNQKFQDSVDFLHDLRKQKMRIAEDEFDIFDAIDEFYRRYWEYLDYSLNQICSDVVRGFFLD